MKLINIRIGFANNSSSSHGFAILKNGRQCSESISSYGDYGWDNFTLTSKDNKWDYLSHIIYDQLKPEEYKEENHTAIALCRELMQDPTWDPSGGYGVDHQSVFRMPLNFDGLGINEAFVQDFKAWLAHESLVILGGNDNDDGHHLAEELESSDLPSPFTYDMGSGRGSLIARKDALSGCWTLFDKETGAKARFDLTPGLAFKALEEEAPKSGLPELVDVKITDYCDIGCGYCYQGSTEEGKHASMEDITTIAMRLAEAEVFEVALGGGETTRHPQFIEILELFASLGIAANFTTRDTSFLLDPQKRERILKASPSFAVSVSSAKEVEKVLEQWVSGGGEQFNCPIAFQYVMGSSSQKEFEELLAASFKAYRPVTLLGFKDVGRGGSWKALSLRDERVVLQQNNWIETIKKVSPRQSQLIQIDTALARESAEALIKEGIARSMWHQTEGLVSMYVDAVKMQMSPSSYDTQNPLAFDQDWGQKFAQWTPTGMEGREKKYEKEAKPQVKVGR